MNHAIRTNDGKIGWARDCGKRGWARIRFPGEARAGACFAETEFTTIYPDQLPLAERWA